MAYEFKRLSDVEKLTKTPEGASALAEVDGAIKRIPVANGSNANLEDMMFDLDIDIISDTGRVSLTNAEQLKKMYDNNMSLHVYYTGFSSGQTYVHHDVYPCINDNMVPNYDMYMGEAYSYLYAGDTSNQLMFIFNQIEESTYVPKKGELRCPSGSVVTKVYAAIF